MATSTVDLSAGLVPKTGDVDLSAGLVPTPPSPAAQQEGFFSSLGHTLGLPTSMEEAKAVADEHSVLKHPVKVLLGPAADAASALFSGAKRSAGEIQQAYQNARDGNAAGAAVHAITAIPIVGPGLDKGSDQYMAGNYAGELGTVLGTALQAAPMAADAVGRPIVRASAPVVARAATAAGEAAQDAGTGLMNKTVGTLKSDFKRGANPGRGYLETGNGPSISMHSIADKAATALEDTGNKLGAAYSQATASGAKIPVDVVAQEMAKPIQKAIDLETGPGGTGNLASIQSYIQQFAPSFEKAAQNGGFTPSELFEMKRAIAQNTNWSDPTQFNLKSVRQQQAGALSGILSDAIPETKALNQTYQDLTKLVGRAEERANTGSRPLTAHIYKAGMTAAGALAGGMEGNALMGAAAGALMDSVPVKTTIASGLFRGGKAIRAFGGRLSPSESSPVVGVPPNDLGGNGAQNKPGNPQLTPPETSNSTTSLQRWAAQGAEKVIAHVENDPSSGLTRSDVAEAANTPQGRQLLIQASSMKPGSPMMKAIINKMTPANEGTPAGEPLNLPDAIDRFREDWPTLALRAQNGEEAALRVGSRLRQSSHWVDNIRTNRKMPGTAGFLLEDATRSNDPADVLESMKGWGYSSHERFVLIGSKEDPVRVEEMPEQHAHAIPKAKILAVIENPFKPPK